MKLKTIRERLNRGGPHIIRTSDGHEYQVPHAEFVHVGRFYVYLEEEDGTGQIIDPEHVVAIRKLASPKSGEGQSHRAA